MTPAVQRWLPYFLGAIRAKIILRALILRDLLRGLAITRPNQVWAMDITYIAMARGFVYLAVALDWFGGVSARLR